MYVYIYIYICNSLTLRSIVSSDFRLLTLCALPTSGPVARASAKGAPAGRAASQEVRLRSPRGTLVGGLSESRHIFVNILGVCESRHVHNILNIFDSIFVNILNIHICYVNPVTYISFYVGSRVCPGYHVLPFACSSSISIEPCYVSLIRQSSITICL